MAGKESVLHARHKHDRKLQALGAVNSHHYDSILVFVVIIDIRHERYFFHELLERRLFNLRLVIQYRTLEFHQIFRPALGFHGIFGFEGRKITCLYEKIVIYVS